MRLIVPLPLPILTTTGNQVSDAGLHPHGPHPHSPDCTPASLKWAGVRQGLGVVSHPPNRFSPPSGVLTLTGRGEEQEATWQS